MQVRNMVKSGVFAALLCVCAWLSIPVGSGAVTLQSFGVFLALGVLGGKWGCVSVLVYLICGSVGLPVFSGFRGGMGVLLSATGGYLWGFLLMGLCYWLLRRCIRQDWVCMAVGQLVCYLCGTVWYAAAYAGGMGFWQVAALCVLPYLIPDAIKLWLAVWLTRRLKPLLTVEDR